MISNKIKTLFSLIFLLSVSCSNEVSFIRLPKLFNDNMVLQQNTFVKFWGRSNANTEITIDASWGENVKCVSNNEGKWDLELKTIKAGGPYELIIKSGDYQRKIKNVLLGEVWLASGQSNMELPMEGAWGSVVKNADKEIEAANYPNIRFIKIEKNIAYSPCDSIVTDGWKVCSPQTVRYFSATAYFFSRELNKELNVPIGIIDASEGGTIIETWMSSKSLLAIDEFKEPTSRIMKLDIKNVKSQFKKDSIQQHNEIIKADCGFNEDNVIYNKQGINTDNWQTFDLPMYWDNTALGNYDGSAWFRKEVILTKEMVKSDIILKYGFADDEDIAWFNQIQVNKSNFDWAKTQGYIIPKGVAKEGENIITIRVLDKIGLGGLSGSSNDFKLILSEGSNINISKQWKVKKGFDYNEIKTFPISAEDPNYPTLLFNGMINPLTPYTIKGVIWYQGESNTGKPKFYSKLFKALINDWRIKWNQGIFPFYFVQLASYMKQNKQPVEDTWAELRNAQKSALDISNTGMVVTVDIGEENNIHPRNKQDVGLRLALIPSARDYGMDIPYSGPLYKGYKVKQNKIEIEFDNVYDGLESKNNEQLQGFSISGIDGVFYWGEAKIVKNKVIVFSNKVNNPVEVRYAWSSNPKCNLINSSGLPASPFTTKNNKSN